MSYYKIINGVKYDKQLLEVATEFITGEGDGRISEREMQLLVKLSKDGRGITAIEQATLFYIRHHFSLTEQARSWFDAQFPPLSEVDALIQKIVVEEFELPGLRVFTAEPEVQAQQALAHNQISFEQALRFSLQSFLSDGTRPESPRNLVENIHEIFPEKFQSETAWEAALTAKVREYLNENSYLALHPLRSLGEEEDLLNQPENGETVDQNWIFQLSLRNLSDHVFWAITDRSGQKPTYSYGFN